MLKSVRTSSFIIVICIHKNINFMVNELSVKNVFIKCFK